MKEINSQVTLDFLSENISLLVLQSEQKTIRLVRLFKLFIVKLNFQKHLMDFVILTERLTNNSLELIELTWLEYFHHFATPRSIH